MIRLLYAGAANLAEPNAGMDLGSRCHFEELSDDRDLSVDAISVCTTGVDPAKAPTRPARLFATDAASGQGGRTILRKLALLARGGILFQTGFMSKAAATALRDGLAAEPDILLVDHIAALANISLGRLIMLRLKGRTKIVVVSHDISSELLRDRARLQASKLRGLAIHLHALHCHLYENVIFGLAHRVFFVSTDDRDTFNYVRRGKTEAMCQVIELPPSDPDATAPEIPGQYLVFVGAPSFFPNGAAIEWIERKLAPALLTRMPDLRIVLVGRRTDVATPDRPANVTGLGFVDDPRLHRILRQSSGSLSPVVYGSGIKIKVLEAIAAGCAIFATEHSLRGYEFMGIDPVLHVDDPERSADRIAAILGDATRSSRFRQDIADQWALYRQRRHGRLAAFVKGAAVSTPERPSALLGQPNAS